MKEDSKLSKKVASVVASSLTLLGTVGFVSGHNSKDQGESKETISNKHSKPQLILTTSADSVYYTLESAQASHSSHSSHSSHGSHASHASHSSSSI